MTCRVLRGKDLFTRPLWGPVGVVEYWGGPLVFTPWLDPGGIWTLPSSVPLRVGGGQVWQSADMHRRLLWPASFLFSNQMPAPFSEALPSQPPDPSARLVILLSCRHGILPRGSSSSTIHFFPSGASANKLSLPQELGHPAQPNPCTQPAAQLSWWLEHVTDSMPLFPHLRGTRGTFSGTFALEHPATL